MTALLQAKDLSLPNRLEATDLSVAAGELVCVIGPNGAGKTSLLHAIARIGIPGGAVRLDGADPAAAGPEARKRLLAFLPASRELPWPVAARDLIRLGLPRTAPERALDDTAAALDLEPFLDRRADQLSTGERSRVLIARALAPEPRLLLLDEPVSNLDPYWQLRLMALLRARCRDSGCAVVAAVHDLDLAGRFADRLIVIHRGRIAADGEPGRLLGSSLMADVFGIERFAEGWRAISPGADRRSSR
ncbi:MAG TPA: ABC transporter ATP-binding protein [Allosphingosinicella sp.]|jgi:iron complex transport system ATP-binding protein